MNKSIKAAVLFAFFITSVISVNAQLRTYDAGSIIIDMGGGASPTYGNSLKPYGLIYELIEQDGTPVSWVINPGKVKDGVDIAYNDGTTTTFFKGGPFVIPAEFVNATVEATCASWAGQGVIYVKTVQPFIANERALLRSVPLWGINIQNAAITGGYLTAAGIPYGPSTPNKIVPNSNLTECEDCYMLAHGDPENDSHASLYRYMQPLSEGGFGGWIWGGCHASSWIEHMDPMIPTKFASYVASGTSGWDFASSIGSYTDRIGAQRNNTTNTNSVLNDLISASKIAI